MKQCRSCGVEKPLSEFHTRRDNGKHRNDCIQCQRDKKNAVQYKQLYNISLSDYDKLYELQGGVCAMCFLPQVDSRKTRLCVDHCHTTGVVRGLLCTNCNVAIGLLKDDERLLQRGIEYLRSTKG
jgi:hypothetical protein